MSSMLDLPRLTIIRQRRLLGELATAAEDKALVKSLKDDVRKALQEVVKAGEPLRADHELPPLLVDNSTDTVFGAFEGFLASIERGMTDKIIAPLPAAQAKKKAAASLLRQRVFPNGTEFLSISMSLQYAAMVNVIDKLRKDAECLAAVKELGAGFFVDHMEAHLKPYGRAVKTTDDRDLEAVGTAFHDAFVRLIVKISALHDGDEVVRKTLWNPYETELIAQRDEDRTARQRSRKKQAEKEKEPVDASEGAKAPAG